MLSKKSAPSVALVTSHALLGDFLEQFVHEQKNLRLVGRAPTVAAAKVLLRREKPRLVIADWSLADGRGADLVRDVGPKLPHTSWILLSAHEQGHIARDAIALGIQGLIMKNSSGADVLREALKRVLAGEKFFCSASSRLLLETLADEARPTEITLTPRERELLRGVACGESILMNAERLGRSVKTVRNLLVMLKDKLGVRDVAGLVHFAIRQGYIEPR